MKVTYILPNCFFVDDASTSFITLLSFPSSRIARVIIGIGDPSFFNRLGLTFSNKKMFYCYSSRMYKISVTEILLCFTTDSSQLTDIPMVRRSNHNFNHVDQAGVGVALARACIARPRHPAR